MPRIDSNDNSGVKLAIKYGYVPCKLGLCGPEDKKNKSLIFRYLKGTNNLEMTNREIQKKFQGAYAYYKLIANANKVKDPLDYRVVQAYWLGNKLLDKVKQSDFKKMTLEEFVPLGKITANRVSQIPKNAIPHHTFHVLFMGSVTGRAKLEGKTLDICRVGWGKIIELKSLPRTKPKVLARGQKSNPCPVPNRRFWFGVKSQNELTIEYQPLIIKKKITLGEPVTKIINWNKDILPIIKKGDWVSIHWNYAIEKLSPTKLKNLKRYTNKILKSIK